MVYDSQQPVGWGSPDTRGPQIYSVTSKHVELPEGVIAKNTVGLLFDRLTLAGAAPEIAKAIAGDIVATAFPDRRCVSLYSEKTWLELRRILRRIPGKTVAQRTIKRISLGFEATISQTDPFMVPVTLESYACLTGNDLLVVESPDYMELWARDRLAI